MDDILSGAVRPDGSIFVVGYTEGDWDGANIGGADFAGAMLTAEGKELWRWMVSEYASPTTFLRALVESVASSFDLGLVWPC